MKENCYGNIFEQLKEEGDDERLNKYLEKKDLYEGVKKVDQLENNLTGNIERPSPNGSTGSTDKIKNLEISQKKIEDKTEKIIKYPTSIENGKKMNENSITIKFKVYPTPKENVNKMNEDSIEKKKETISQNNVKSNEKNMNLSGHKEPKEPFNILIGKDCDGDIDMKNINDDYKSQRIKGSIIGSNQNKQEINFSTIATIRTNQGVGEEDYKVKDENNPSYIFPIEDDDKLNSLDLNNLGKIKCNHHHY